MRIHGGHLESFGIFRDQPLPPLAPGLVVACGANEAGKSTLLAFIRWALFGGLKSGLYEPASGQRAGHLLLRTEDGQSWQLRRADGKRQGVLSATGPAGPVAEEEALERLLGRTSLEEFRNVFAFSLKELESIASIDEAVKSGLYGTSLGSTLTALPQAEKRLAEELASRFNERGQKPLINVALSKLDKLRADQRQAAEECTQYEGLEGELQQLTTRLADLDTRRRQAEAALQRAKLLDDCWPHWQGYVQAQKELAALAPADSYPREGRARLAELRRLLAVAQQALVAVGAKVSDLQAKSAALPLDQALLARAAEVDALARGVELWQQRGERLRALARRRQTLQDALRRGCAELGPGWDAARLRAADRSLARREAIEQHARRLDEARAEVQRRQAKLETLSEEWRRQQDKVAAAAKDAATAAAPPGLCAADLRKQVQEGRNEFAGVVRDLPLVAAELQANESAVAKAASDLHPGWTLADVSACDVTDAALRQVQTLGQELSDARQDLRQAEKLSLETRSAESAAQEKQRAVAAQAQAYPAPTPEVVAAANARVQAFRELAQALPQHERWQAELRRLEAEAARQVAAATPPPVPARAGWLAPGVIGGAALLLVAAGLLTHLGWLLACGVVLVVGAGLAAAYTVWDARRAAAPPPPPPPVSAALRQEQEAAEEKLAQVAGQIEGWRRQLGLAREADDATRTRGLAEAEARLEALRGDELMAKEKAAHLQQANDIMAQATLALKGHLQQVVVARERVTAAEQAWREFAAPRHLRGDLQPADGLDLLRQARTLRQRVADLEQPRTRLALMRAAEAKYRALIASAGVPGAATRPREELVTAVDEFVRTQEQLANAVRDQAEQQRAVLAAKEGETQAAVAVEQAKAQEQLAQTALAEAQAAWLMVLRELGLAEKLTPQLALDALKIIADGLKLVDEVDALNGEEKELLAQQAAWAAVARALLAALTRPVPAEDEALPGAVKALAAELAVMQQRRAEAAGLAVKLEDALSTQRSLKEDEAKQTTATAELLAAAGCAGAPEHFLVLAERWEARQALAQRAHDHEAKLVLLAGVQQAAELAGELAEQSPTVLASRRAEGQRQVEELEREARDLVTRRATLEEQRRRLADSDQVARLAADEETLRAQVRVQAEDWARYQIAAWLLGEAKRRFERERQPKVIQAACGYFQTITAGRYPEIRMPLGEEQLQVRRDDGTWLPPDRLSRGAQEQLYLAIRFGYIAQHKAGGEALPVIMDDILVNFDPDRARHSAAAIADLAKTRQVIFFTCHPHTRDMLAAAAGSGAQVLSVVAGKVQG